MKKFPIFVAFALLAAVTSCNKTNDAEDRIDDKIEAQKDTIDARAERAKDSLDSLKEVYQARMDSVDTNYAVVEREYNEAKGKTKAELKRRLDSLGVHRETLRSKWNDLKAATNETWDKVRAEWDTLWGNFDREFKGRRDQDNTRK